MPQDKNQRVQQIKESIDDLRREWDQLDAHGCQSERQGRINDQIERLQEQLKGLTGEEY